MTQIKMLRDMMAGSSMLAIDQLGNSSMAHGDMQSRCFQRFDDTLTQAD